MMTFKDTWGRMASCGRLAIGLARFVPSSKPITNRLQVTNLPHGTNHLLESRTGLYTRQTIEIKSDAPKYGFVLSNRLFGKRLKWPHHAQPRLTLCHDAPPRCPSSIAPVFASRYNRRAASSLGASLSAQSEGPLCAVQQKHAAD